MNNASKGIKLAISSIDNDVITPIIEETFTFNMLYDKDTSIKGDVSIIARGATAMLTREQAQLRRAEFLNMTNNDVDMAIIGPEGRIEILRAAADLLDLNTDKIVPEQEEYIARQKKAQEQGQQEEDPRLTEVKMKIEQEKQKAVIQDEQFKKQLDFKTKAEVDKLEAQERLQQQKLDKEYDFKMKILDEEARQRELERDIEREKDAETRTDEINIIREKVSLERESKEKENESGEKQEKIPQLPAPTINLVIDNKSGEVRKTIDITRGADKMISSAEIKEYPIDGD